MTPLKRCVRPKLGKKVAHAMPGEQMDRETLTAQRDALNRALRLKNEQLGTLESRLQEESQRREALERSLQSVELAWQQVRSRGFFRFGSVHC